jgi:hypothetical protein
MSHCMTAVPKKGLLLLLLLLPLLWLPKNSE